MRWRTRVVLLLRRHGGNHAPDLARIEGEELEQFLRGCGWAPLFVEGDDPDTMHERMATVIESAIQDIHRIRAKAHTQQDPSRPRWPMIVLRSPKGWTGPKVVDGLQIEGTFRAHQVPMLVDREHLDHVPLLESCMRSYKPEELFDQNGRLIPELAELAPKGDRRMGANPHANGGLLLHDLKMPDFYDHAVQVSAPGAIQACDTQVLGSSCVMCPSSIKASVISAFLVRTRRFQTSWAPCSKSPTASGTRRK
jgi:xylulose-5-phosphate/fructose-6-phosphate phosphoketolase